jgi:hypothetical protein
MKRLLCVVLLLACTFLLVGCEEPNAKVTITETEVEVSETAETERTFGLTEKEVEEIEDIISKPYSGGYTLDDVAEIVRDGYGQVVNEEGALTDNPNMFRYSIVFKNGESTWVDINKILLED